MRADVIFVLLTCASVGAIIIQEGGDTLSKDRYCDLTGGGFGLCKEKEKCARDKAAQTEKCSSPLVCCPLPGVKATQKCEEYSRIETGSFCPERDNQAAQLKEFPHMAAVGYNNIRNNVWLCGGVLISNRFVLTTAVCSSNARIGPPRRVRIGDLEITDREVSEVQQVSVEEVIVHPDFRESKISNDIALLKLSRDVKLSSSVRPACLHTTTELPATTGVALGWGRTSGDKRPDELLKVRMPFTSSEACEDAYNWRLTGEKINTTSMICAGDKGRDTCTGDSGGPLQITKNGPNCMGLIVGLTSFGNTQCGGSDPGVYTRVSHFVPWIESVIWP